MTKVETAKLGTLASIAVVALCVAFNSVPGPVAVAQPAAKVAKAAAPALTVDGPYTLVVTAVPFKVNAPPGYKLYVWQLPAGWVGDAPVLTPLPTLTITKAAGAGEVVCVAIQQDFSTALMKLSLAVGTTPTPGPGPDPGPGPTPVPTGAVKVLIIEDKKLRTTLPAGQKSLVSPGKTFRDYLNAVCAPEPNLTNYSKAWAVWDKDVDASNAPKWWQDALARPRTGLPWVVIANDRGEFVHGGPLPADEAATRALIGKFLPTKLRKAG